MQSAVPRLLADMFLRFGEQELSNAMKPDETGVKPDARKVVDELNKENGQRCLIQNYQNYFTSSNPRHDIYTFCYWQIFWHSI